jgi:hypothetical protein
MTDFLCLIAFLLIMLFIIWAITPDDIGEKAKKYLDERAKEMKDKNEQ